MNEPGAVCHVCGCWYPQEKIVYGRDPDPQFALHPPEHWCKMHAKMYGVEDYEVIRPKGKGSSGCKTNRIPH